MNSLLLLMISAIEGSLHASAEISTCEAIRANAGGFNLVCCSETEKLQEDCQYELPCSTTVCRCHLNITEDLRCSLDQTSYRRSMHQWQDHSSIKILFPCSLPDFPNRHAEYFVKMIYNDSSYGKAVLYGLSRYNIISLSLVVTGDAQLPATFESREPWYQRLSVAWAPKIPIHCRADKNDGRFSTFEIIPAWINRIERIHIQKSSLATIPTFLQYCNKLTRIVLRETAISNISPITKLRTLRSLKITQSKLKSLEDVEFLSDSIQEIDLSNNLITVIGRYTFAHCANLSILNLANNPIKSLPYRGLQQNNRLQYLNLANTKIKVLSANHLLGLTSLQALIFSSTPLSKISPFAFISLRSLQILYLDACNLTELPWAVTYCCNLTSLHLSQNLFYDERSLPVERISHLTQLSVLSFDRNPLAHFPIGFFLVPQSNHELLSQILDNIITLPLWHREPCTRYLWNLHLTNSSPVLYNRVAQWSREHLKRDQMEHCLQLFHKIHDKLEPYRWLQQNSYCFSARNLQMVQDECQSLLQSRKQHFWKNPSIINQTSIITRTLPFQQYIYILVVSVVSNIFLLGILGALLVFVTIREF